MTSDLNCLRSKNTSKEARFVCLQAYPRDPVTFLTGADLPGIVLLRNLRWPVPYGSSHKGIHGIDGIRLVWQVLAAAIRERDRLERRTY